MKPTTKDLKESFLELAGAIDHLLVAKEHILALYELSDEVDNANFLMENHHRFASPESDTHDILFARHEQAKEKLTNAIRLGKISLIRSQIDEAAALAKQAGDKVL